MIRPLTLLALLVACKPPPPCEPAAAASLQLLASADPRLNLDEHGSSWPVHLRVFTLAPGATPQHLDFAALFTDPTSALGAAPRALHEFTLFPGQRERFTLPAPEDDATILVAALFRRPLGQSWYIAAAAPRPRACTDLCLYLSLARDELAGGRFPPPGFPIHEFAAVCAPLHTPAPGAHR